MDRCNYVVIRTNTFGTKLSVNGTDGDTVTHYGFAGLVEVKKVAMSSYDEYGVVGRLSATADGATGHIDIKEGATVYQVEQLGGTSTSVSVDENATVYDINHEKVTEAISEDNERFTTASKDGFEVTETHSTNGGERITAQECVHEHSEDVIDGQHVYEVCKTCGYTVIKVNSNKKTVATANNENVIIPKAAYDSTQVTNGDTNGDVRINTNSDGSYVTPSIEETPIVDPNYPADTTCIHNFGEGTIIVEATCTHEGSKTYSCSKCGISYSSILPLKAHNYVTKSDDGTDNKNHEYCSVCGSLNNDKVAEVNGEKYATVRAAVDSITSSEQTLITLCANENIDIVGNAIVIPSGKNIIIDLNGYSINGWCDLGSGNALIYVNSGSSLIIKDTSDTLKNGTGTGSISYYTDDADLKGVPGYASNLITNKGKLTIVSGKLLNNSSALAAFAIDSQGTWASSEVEVNILGGCIEASSSYGIRVCVGNTVNTVFTMTGANVSSLWIQNYGNATNGGMLDMSITGGNITGKMWLEITYSDSGDKHKSDGANMHIHFGGDLKHDGDMEIENWGSPINNYDFIIDGGTYNGIITDAYGELTFVKGGTFNNTNTWFYTGYAYAKNAWGGGAINDMGSYLVSIGLEESLEDTICANATNYTDEVNGFKFEYHAGASSASGANAYILNVLSPSFNTDWIISGYKAIDNGNSTITIIKK